MQRLEESGVEDVFMAVLLRLSIRMRRRLPGDPVDHTLLPVLRAIDQLQPLRHTELAEAVQLDTSTVSRHVRHLEERGLARSTPDPSDGRVRLVELLPAAHDVIEQMGAQRRAILRETLSSWPEAERAQLASLMTRLLADLDADQTPTATTRVEASR